MSNEATAEYRRRSSDGLIGQIKALWPVLAVCCAGWAAWKVQEAKVEGTVKTVTDTVDRVNAIERKMDVHGQMLSDIRDAVKDIARRQRRAE